MRRSDWDTLSTPWYNLPLHRPLSHRYVMTVGWRHRGKLRRFLNAFDVHYVEEWGLFTSVIVSHSKTAADCDFVEKWFQTNIVGRRDGSEPASTGTPNATQ